MIHTKVSMKHIEINGCPNLREYMIEESWWVKMTRSFKWKYGEDSRQANVWYFQHYVSIQIMQNSWKHRTVHSTQYIIMVQLSSEVLITQTGESSWRIRDYYEGSSTFLRGRSVPCEHVTVFQKISWPKASTIQYINVNILRKKIWSYAF